MSDEKPARRTGLVLILVLILALGGAGAWIWREETRIAAFGQKIETLEVAGQSLAGLSARLQALEAREPPKVDLGPVTARLDAIESKPDAAQEAARAAAESQHLEGLVTGLDARLNALETRGPSAALEARVVTLEQDAKIAPKLETADHQRMAALATLMLVQAVDRGAPFGAELDNWRRIAGDDTAFDALKPIAAQGLPRRDQLMAEFPAVTRAIRAVSPTEEPAKEWWRRLIDHAASLIVVRQTKPMAGDAPEAVLARAETAVSKAELNEAADALGALTGPQAQAAEDWIAKVKLRRIAETTLVGLSSRLVAPAEDKP